MTQITHPTVFSTDDITYRIVCAFQYRENYGAHCWDGEGACPQYWKNKGGDVITFMDDIPAEIIRGGGKSLYTFINGLLQKSKRFFKRHQWADEYSEQMFCGWDFEVSQTETHDEEIDHMDRDWSRDAEWQHFRNNVMLKPEDERYIHLAADCGFDEYGDEGDSYYEWDWVCH